MSTCSRQRFDDNPPDNNRQSTPQRRQQPHHATPDTDTDIDTDTDTDTTDTTAHTSTSPFPAQVQVHFFQVARGLSRCTKTTYFCTERGTRQLTDRPRPTHSLEYTEREPTEQVMTVFVIQKRESASERAVKRGRERELDSVYRLLSLTSRTLLRVVLNL